jgi:hypothetical protein
MEPARTHDPSIGTLLKGIADDVQTLIREEIALARVEVGQQTARAKAAAMSIGIAAGALLFGGGLLLAALSLGIADAFDWPAWAGFGVVGLVLVVGGLAAYAAARNRLNAVHIVPEETISTLKENSAWIAKRLSSEPR